MRLFLLDYLTRVKLLVYKLFGVQVTRWANEYRMRRVLAKHVTAIHDCISGRPAVGPMLFGRDKEDS